MKAQGSVGHSDPEILGGTPVFVGTRVPIKPLLIRPIFRDCAVPLGGADTLPPPAG